jgi:hypothetical protein
MNRKRMNDCVMVARVSLPPSDEFWERLLIAITDSEYSFQVCVHLFGCCCVQIGYRGASPSVEPENVDASGH